MADRPSRFWPFSQADGYRYLLDGTPVCVHPEKIGLTPEHIAPPPQSLESRIAPKPQRRRWFRGL
ncbi:hypothetical protein [Streptomyces sp. NPDC002044]|uniref:hypothetical protein n=1 Tax=Streptomyces sp. NPDC002044 TaxID=3154662 RepID=UPI00332E4434